MISHIVKCDNPAGKYIAKERRKLMHNKKISRISFALVCAVMITGATGMLGITMTKAEQKTVLEKVDNEKQTEVEKEKGNIKEGDEYVLFSDDENGLEVKVRKDAEQEVEYKLVSDEGEEELELFIFDKETETDK